MKIVKPNEAKDIYEKNLKLLTPWLKESVSKISEEELWKKIEINYNDEGLPVCSYHRDGFCFHITSERPIQEAEIWCKSIELDTSEVFLYGTGFGYALFELFAQKAPHTLVIVYEQDLFLFKAMLYYFDLSPIIETKKIIFLIGDISHFKTAFEELFYSLVFFSTTYPSVAFTLPAQRSFKKEYLEIHRYIFKELSLLVSYLGNDHQDNMIGLRNMMANVKEILENPYVSCLKDKYRNIPAFIISNGPSLDKSINKLKSIQGKGLMIAVESAIVPLTKNGIKPDILAVQERTKYTYLYHFHDRNYSPEIALLALALVDPRVFPSFAGEKIPVFRKGEELNLWFNRNLGDNSALDAGANVSHLAAGVAMFLGADPIIFVGQDFAYGSKGVTHSKDAVASQEKGKRAREHLHSIPTVYVEGNNGKMIPSNLLWTEFRTILERIISHHPEHKFYNATEGGAKIQGTDRAELDQLIQQYCTEPIPYSVNNLISENRVNISLAKRTKLLEDFIMEIERYVVMFQNLAHETNLKMVECKKMMRLSLEEEDEQNKKVLDETYQKNVASFYQYADDTLSRSFFQQVICAYFYLLNRLGTINTQEKRAQAFDIQSQFYHDLCTLSQSLSVTLEESLESLNTVLEELRKKEA